MSIKAQRIQSMRYFGAKAHGPAGTWFSLRYLDETRL
jgi:hypothetical protein